MRRQTALVTGAGGFVGRYLANALQKKGYCVRAGIRTVETCERDRTARNIAPYLVDIMDQASLAAAMDGVDCVFHLAALVDSSRSREELYAINVRGTQNVWESAAHMGVQNALYCSTTAVYGLLAGSASPITEEVPARAIEPYGHSKLLGEGAALEVAARTGLHTTIIRPVAVFGPDERTPFGRNLRDAAFSKVLIAGGFQNKRFNFVYVDDVADAAIHLMERDLPQGEIYNVAVNTPVLFEEALRSYVRVLGRAGRQYARTRFLGLVSLLLHRAPPALDWLARVLGERTFFQVWHPGFDLVYSSGKLQRTAFHPRWDNFEDVLSLCVRK